MKYGLALDIDETLSATGFTWMEHLRSLYGNPENLTSQELFEKYKDIRNVPYWQSEEALVYMHTMIHSDTFQMDIALIENANELVHKIHQIIPIVAYITARPSSVIQGTKHWLAKHGFPEAPLITRPDNVHLDDRSKWKAKVLEDMYPEVMGIVDDHVELADHLSKNYKGQLFLFNTVSHERKDISVIACKTWGDVYDAVLKISEGYKEQEKVHSVRITTQGSSI